MNDGNYNNANNNNDGDNNNDDDDKSSDSDSNDNDSNDDSDEEFYQLMTVTCEAAMTSTCLDRVLCLFLALIT